jgi:nicotinate-nucleotide adenylyltransferase
MANKRIAFYGGSFNPPHVGHQSTVLYALETARVEKLYVVPAYTHPHGKKLAPWLNRLDMCERMVIPFSMQKVAVSTIEKEAYNQNGHNITADTLPMFRQAYGISSVHDTVVMVMGSDIRDAIEDWEGYDRLKEQIQKGVLEFFYVDRAAGLSSTAVRDAIAHNRSIARMVPDSVSCYIFNHPGLY